MTLDRCVNRSMLMLTVFHVKDTVTMLQLKISAAGLAQAACVLFPAACQSATFTTIDCPGATSTQALSLNNHGWVVGTCFYSNALKSFYRTPDGVVHVFTVQKTSTFVNDIMEAGIGIG